MVVRCNEGFTVEQNKKQLKGKLALFLLSPESMSQIYLRLIAAWMKQGEDNPLTNQNLSIKSQRWIKKYLRLK